MKSIVKRIFGLLWLLFFLQDALEVNACGIENTFNDDYDTYIAAGTANVPLSGCVIIDCDFQIVSAGLVSWNSDTLHLVASSFLYEDDRYVCCNPPPLNILHSVWII